MFPCRQENLRGHFTSFLHIGATKRAVHYVFLHVGTLGSMEGPSSHFLAQSDNLEGTRLHFPSPKGNLEGTRSHFYLPKDNLEGTSSRFPLIKGNLKGTRSHFRSTIRHFFILSWMQRNHVGRLFMCNTLEGHIIIYFLAHSITLQGIASQILSWKANLSNNIITPRGQVLMFSCTQCHPRGHFIAIFI